MCSLRATSIHNYKADTGEDIDNALQLQLDIVKRILPTSYNKCICVSRLYRYLDVAHLKCQRTYHFNAIQSYDITLSLLSPREEAESIVITQYRYVMKNTIFQSLSINYNSK